MNAASKNAAPADGVVKDIDDAVRVLARREAVVEAGEPDGVGDIVDSYADADDTITVRFAAVIAGYHGWQWSVTVAVVDADRPTVSEAVLLPGPEALIAPEWVPWDQRLRSGDLGPGDLLPAAPEDERLAPAYLQSDDPAVEEVAHELGIGRLRVMSRIGRDDAATRWHTGSFGPDDEMAKQAPGHCGTCAFYLPIAGSLGAGFGVCGNEYSPAEAHAVDVAFGCGAHSETVISRRSSANPDTVIDELQLEVHQHSGDGSADRAGSEGEDGSAGDADSEDRAGSEDGEGG